MDPHCPGHAAAAGHVSSPHISRSRWPWISPDTNNQREKKGPSLIELTTPKCSISSPLPTSAEEQSPVLLLTQDQVLGTQPASRGSPPCQLAQDAFEAISAPPCSASQLTTRPPDLFFRRQYLCHHSVGRAIACNDRKFCRQHFGSSCRQFIGSCQYPACAYLGRGSNTDLVGGVWGCEGDVPPTASAQGLHHPRARVYS